MKLGVVILAAGKGTRMKSALPKVLHPLAKKPLLGHVIDTARQLDPEKIVVVYGHGGDLVKETFSEDNNLEWAEQAEQLGTGHAVQQAVPFLDGLDQILVLYGDVPLTSADTLKNLLDVTADGFGLLTVDLENPMGYGRIVRDVNHKVERIVEQKDATDDELEIKEINTGIMLLPGAKLSTWLSNLSNSNAQNEYYLTDVLAMAVSEGIEIQVSQPDNVMEAEGVNNRIQLSTLEREYQRIRAEELMVGGVSLADPARVDVRGNLQHGQDVSFDVNVIIEGDVTIGDNVSIGANTVIRDSVIESNVTILENCVIEQAHVGVDSSVGPFSRLRPGAELTGNAHIGNFVEIKKSVVGLNSKVNHLTYIGDTEIGVGVNIGAGTITCNYDGAYKHKTIIKDKAFIGSNSALVAPVTIGENATVGAGSVIGKDAPDDKLSLTRVKQVSLNYNRPTKNKN